MMSSTSPTRSSLILSMIQAAPFRVVKRGLGQRGADEGRADRVDADALFAPFDRHGFDHAFQPVFGRAIERPVDPTHMTHLA